MPKLDALFPGFESFMENDVEINNEINVPEAKDDTLDDAAAAVTNETDSGDLGAEGAELVGEAKNNVTESEATGMIFDQMFSMYDHVKQFGIDRTFLSLYNRNGKLNELVNFQFPSCESLDCVGSPTSQLSQVFLVAMEDENGGIFAKFKDWIASIFRRIKRLIGRVLEWFRDKFISTGSRIDKLKDKLNKAEFYKKDEIDKDDDLPDIQAYAKFLSSKDINNLTAKAQKCGKMLDTVKSLITRGAAGSVAIKDYADVTVLCEKIEKEFKKVKDSKMKSGKAFSEFGKASRYLTAVNGLETFYKGILVLRNELVRAHNNMYDVMKILDSKLSLRSAEIKHYNSEADDYNAERGKSIWKRMFTRKADHISDAQLNEMREYRDDCKSIAIGAERAALDVIRATYLLDRIISSMVGAIARHVSYFSK